MNFEKLKTQIDEVIWGDTARSRLAMDIIYAEDEILAVEEDRLASKVALVRKMRRDLHNLTPLALKFDSSSKYKPRIEKAAGKKRRELVLKVVEKLAALTGGKIVIETLAEHVRAASIDMMIGDKGVNASLAHIVSNAGYKNISRGVFVLPRAEDKSESLARSQDSEFGQYLNGRSVNEPHSTLEKN